MLVGVCVGRATLVVTRDCLRLGSQWEAANSDWRSLRLDPEA